MIEDGSIDAGLLVLDITRKVNREYTRQEIAEICGCTPQFIAYLELKALRKMKKTLEQILNKKGIDYEKCFYHKAEITEFSISKECQNKM